MSEREQPATELHDPGRSHGTCCVARQRVRAWVVISYTATVLRVQRVPVLLART